MSHIKLLGIALGSLLCALLLAGCPGDNDGNPPRPPTTVTITGVVDDGTPTSPIPNARCRFIDNSGRQRATVQADGSGRYRLAVPPDVGGRVICSPTDLNNLELMNFATTAGRQAGETVDGEDVEPATTVIGLIIISEAMADPQSQAATDPQAREGALRRMLERGNRRLTLMVDAATQQYNAMLASQINLDFGDGEGNGDGDGDGDGGGAGGGAGDGGEFSPIPNAACDFALGPDTDTPSLVNATLEDLLRNGRIDRPDLAAIAPALNAAFEEQQNDLSAAFNAFFPGGLGRPFQVEADAEGQYFIRTPVNVPGFVRCRPPDAANLAMSRFVPARMVDERQEGRDVTPITTVIDRAVVEAMNMGQDPIANQNRLLASIDFRIVLSEDINNNGILDPGEDLNGNGSIDPLARVLPNNGALADPGFVLLASSATITFDAMRDELATLPPDITFQEALDDFFADSIFNDPAFAGVEMRVVASVEAPANRDIIGLGIADIPNVRLVISAFAGTYTGTFMGDAGGTFTAEVDQAGNITGNAVTDDGTMGSGTGSVDSAGRIVFGITAIGATFTGTIDSSGNISGTWDTEFGQSGTFSGMLELSVFAGTYTGTFMGDDRGTFTVEVDQAGNITGDAVSEIDGTMGSVTGRVDSTGRIVFGFTTTGAMFTGTIDASGNISGTWVNPEFDESGTFSGMLE